MENINYWKLSHPTEIGDTESKYLVLLIHKICKNLKEIVRSLSVSEEHIEDWVKSPRQKKNMRKFLQCLEEFKVGEITDTLKDLVFSSVECSAAYNGFCNDKESTRDLGFTDFILDIVGVGRKSKWKLINELLNDSTPFNRHDGINEKGFVKVFEPLVVGKYLLCYSMLDNSENPLYKEKITGIEAQSIDDGEYQICLSLESDTKTESKLHYSFYPKDIVAMIYGHYVICGIYEEKEPPSEDPSSEEFMSYLTNGDMGPIKDVIKFKISSY